MADNVHVHIHDKPNHYHNGNTNDKSSEKAKVICTFVLCYSSIIVAALIGAPVWIYGW